MNIDEHPLHAAEHGVLSLPTVILFEGGAARETVVGARPRGHFEQPVRRLARGWPPARAEVLDSAP